MSTDLILLVGAAVVLVLVLLVPDGKVRLPGLRQGVPKQLVPWLIGGGLAYYLLSSRKGKSPGEAIKAAVDAIGEAASLKGAEEIAGKLGTAQAADYVSKLKATFAEAAPATAPKAPGQ